MDDKATSSIAQPGMQAQSQPAAPSIPSAGSVPPVTPEQPQISGFDKPLPKPRPEAGSAPVNLPPVHAGKPFLKIIFGVIAVIIVIVLLIAFWPKGAPEKVTLTWWGLWEDPKVIKAVVSDFERENPHITIAYTKEDPKQYRERLMTRIDKGTGPDIFRFHNSWYPMIAAITSPLPSDVVTVDEFKKNYYPVIQKDLIHNGAIYGIPMGVDTISLFVNTDLLKAAGVAVPKTWDEFVKAAKSLTVKDAQGKIKTAGAAFGAFNNVNHASDIVSLLFVQQGVDLNKFTESSNDAMDALDFYTSFATGDNKIWDSTLDTSILAFSQGKAAMYFGYSWDIFTIQRYNKDLPFSIYPVPKLFNRDMTIASYWSEGVSAKSSHQKEAFLFMKYLAKKETAQKLYAEAVKTRPFGPPYARVDLANSLKDNARVYPFVVQLPHATSSFFASDTFDGEGGLNTLANTYLGKTIDAIVIDNSSPGSQIEELNNGMTQVFNKYAVQ